MKSKAKRRPRCAKKGVRTLALRLIKVAERSRLHVLGVSHALLGASLTLAFRGGLTRLDARDWLLRVAHELDYEKRVREALREHAADRQAARKPDGASQ